jgi:hypothetical protein
MPGILRPSLAMVFAMLCCVLWSVLCCVLCSVPCLAQSQSSLGQLHLVYIGHSSDPQFQWFHTNPELAQLKKSVTWSHLKPTDTIFMERYRPVLGDDLPMVILERADGGTIYAASGKTLPKYGSDLFAKLRESFHLAKAAAAPVRAEELLYESQPCVGPFCPTPDASGFPISDQSRLLPLRKDPFEKEGIVSSVTNLVWLILALGAFGFCCFVLFLAVWLVSIFMRSP